jgi:hypothetical protein
VDAIFSKLRIFCAAITAAGLVLGASPVRAVDHGGLGGFQGPVATWLARAPASCAATTYFGHTATGYHAPPKHVAYWVGNAVKGDLKQVDRFFKAHASWSGMTSGGVERSAAVDDPVRHIAAYEIGGTDMFAWGAFADQPDPPANAPPMRADLSSLSLGGNVHLGDSLATVRSALGLASLTPTDTAPLCPGYGVVELCSWNVAGCACPESMSEDNGGVSGTIIFRKDRVVGLIWDAKCFASG